MHPSITINDATLEQSISVDFEIELLDSGSTFSEGPIWNEEGYYLFSDNTDNVISKIAPGSAKQVYLPNSGCSEVTALVRPEMKGSNGLGYDANKNLIICQHGNHAIAQYNGTTISTIVNSYKGRPFNSPNDIIIHNDGRIFFSDPPYALLEQKLHPDSFQPIAGVYCWQNGNTELICDAYQYPNGVCLSPDQRLLYICSNKPFERFVTQIDTSNFSNRTILCQENGDGIECDRKGNIYLCAKEGVVIVNSNGKRLGLIEFETQPSNLCWGGTGGNDLFVTARQNVFLIKNLQKA